MPLPAPGSYHLILPPFPYPLLVHVGPPPMFGLTLLGLTGPYVPSQDVFSFGPTFGVTCNGGTWTAVLPDKQGNPVELTGPCEGPLP